jgi:hypothetical protein
VGVWGAGFRVAPFYLAHRDGEYCGDADPDTIHAHLNPRL